MAAQDRCIDVVVLTGDTPEMQIDGPSTGDKERDAQTCECSRNLNQHFHFVQRATPRALTIRDGFGCS